MYCPFSQQDCKTSDCVMHNNGDCLIQSWLKGRVVLSQSADTRNWRVPDPDPAICKWLTDTPIKGIAKELAQYVRECTPDDQDPYYTWGMDSKFFNSKGLVNIPESMQDKIDQATHIAEQILTAERLAKEHARTFKERKKLPKIIEDCIAWAKELGLRSLTFGEVDEFLNQQGIELERRNRQSLKVQINIRLKQTKPH